MAAETERTASFNKCKTTKIIQSMSQIITCVHAQSCPIHRIPMDCSPPGSSVHRIFQARTLEWIPISSSRGSFQPRDQTRFLCLLYWQADSLPLSQIIIKLNKNKEHEIIREIPKYLVNRFLNKSQVKPKKEIEKIYSIIRNFKKHVSCS